MEYLQVSFSQPNIMIRYQKGRLNNGHLFDVPVHREARLILGLRPANERRLYKVRSSLIAQAQT